MCRTLGERLQRRRSIGQRRSGGFAVRQMVRLSITHGAVRQLVLADDAGLSVTASRRRRWFSCIWGWRCGCGDGRGGFRFIRCGEPMRRRVRRDVNASQMVLRETLVRGQFFDAQNDGFGSVTDGWRLGRGFCWW